MASPESRVSSWTHNLPGSEQAASDKPDGPYKVDHDVPVPPKASERVTKYPFPEMAVGDSFELGEGSRYRVISASNHYVRAHRPGWRFIVRKTAPGVCRCWRVA